MKTRDKNVQRHAGFSVSSVSHRQQRNLSVVFTCLFAAKPISLVERCWCRSTLNTVPQRSIKELKFLHTPNCPFQVM